MLGPLLLAATLVLPAGAASHLQQTPPTATESAPMTHAHGSFEVKVTPQPQGPAEGLASYTLDKTYTGELDATGTGQMLSAGDPKAGNAGYVAIERITGKLTGPRGVKTGTFALMQQGTMIDGSAPQLTVTIVPGSGTGDLSGIYGSMTITISGGKHSYTLDYAFAAR